MNGVSLEHAKRRDRAILIGASALVAAMAWGVLLRMPGHGHGGHGDHAMTPHGSVLDLASLAMAFAMWMAMMVGMMLPVVLPWILAFAGVRRAADMDHSPVLAGGVFATGYLAIWSIYSLLGAAVQLVLQQQAWLGSGLETTPLVGGVILVLAGLFQFSALKEACLAHCRSPVGFFLERWQDGPAGAFRLGFRHGLYCVGCCWALMALMFAVGVMNLAWMAVLAVVMLAEQLAPRRWALARLFGAGLIVWGLALALVR